MRTVISAVAVASLFAVAFPGYAGGPNDARVDSGAIKSAGAAQKGQRAVNQDHTLKPSVPTEDPTMGGRSPFIDEGAGKSAAATAKPHRAAADGQLGAGGVTDKPGRSADQQKPSKHNQQGGKKAKPPTN